MKKNTMMRLASFLLVAVLISTSAISGTYAKYVTSDSAEDTARVAKFGVVVTADGSLFSKTYMNKANDNIPGITSLTVNSMTDKNGDLSNVVAPGTQNTTGMTFSVTGQPEVDVNVEFKFEATSEIMLEGGTTFDNPTTGDVDTYTVGAKDYYPVVFTLSNDAGVLVTGNVAAIQDYLTNNVNDVYPAQTNLAEITGGTAGTYTLTWAWNFDYDGAGTYDVEDTYLGNAAAAEYFGESFPTDGTELDMDVKFTITVTQVD